MCPEGLIPGSMSATPHHPPEHSCTLSVSGKAPAGPGERAIRKEILGFLCLWVSGKLGDLRTTGLSMLIAERAQTHCAPLNNGPLPKDVHILTPDPGNMLPYVVARGILQM